MGQVFFFLIIKLHSLFLLTTFLAKKKKKSHWKINFNLKNLPVYTIRTISCKKFIHPMNYFQTLSKLKKDSRLTCGKKNVDNGNIFLKTQFFFLIIL